MSRADHIYRKEQEIDEINRDMRAINPALNLYKVLSDRRAKLEAEVQEFDKMNNPWWPRRGPAR